MHCPQHVQHDNEGLSPGQKCTALSMYWHGNEGLSSEVKYTALSMSDMTMRGYHPSHSSKDDPFLVFLSDDLVLKIQTTSFKDLYYI